MSKNVVFRRAWAAVVVATLAISIVVGSVGYELARNSVHNGFATYALNANHSQVIRPYPGSWESS